MNKLFYLLFCGLAICIGLNASQALDSPLACAGIFNQKAQAQIPFQEKFDPIQSTALSLPSIEFYLAQMSTGPLDVEFRKLEMLKTNLETKPLENQNIKSADIEALKLILEKYQEIQIEMSKILRTKRSSNYQMARMILDFSALVALLIPGSTTYDLVKAGYFRLAILSFSTWRNNPKIWAGFTKDQIKIIEKSQVYEFGSSAQRFLDNIQKGKRMPVIIFSHKALSLSNLSLQTYGGFLELSVPLQNDIDFDHFHTLAFSHDYLEILNNLNLESSLYEAGMAPNFINSFVYLVHDIDHFTIRKRKMEFEQEARDSLNSNWLARIQRLDRPPPWKNKKYYEEILGIFESMASSDLDEATKTAIKWYIAYYLFENPLDWAIVRENASRIVTPDPIVLKSLTDFEDRTPLLYALAGVELNSGKKIEEIVTMANNNLHSGFSILKELISKIKTPLF